MNFDIITCIFHSIHGCFSLPCYTCAYVDFGRQNKAWEFTGTLPHGPLSELTAALVQHSIHLKYDNPPTTGYCNYHYNEKNVSYFTCMALQVHILFH